MRPLLQASKKQRQKQVREARAAQAREEERHKVEEMRRRRTAKIERLSGVLSKWIIRSFLINEINAIFDKESIACGSKSEVLPAQQLIDSEIKPVLVTGSFFLRKSLTRRSILDLFPGVECAKDADGEPKIGFRTTGNYTEALLFLAKKEDVRAVLGMGSTMTDCGAVHVSLDDEPSQPVHTLFTGEKVVFASGVNNSEFVTGEKGVKGLVRACPAADIAHIILQKNH
jgi:hypothetical protein